MTRAYQLCRSCGHARLTHQHFAGWNGNITAWCSDLSCGCPRFRAVPLLARISQLLEG